MLKSVAGPISFYLEIGLDYLAEAQKIFVKGAEGIVIHRLIVGHFDRKALKNGRFVVTRSISESDLNLVAESCNGRFDKNKILLQGHTITVVDGYLECPWKTPWLNTEVVEFIKLLHAKIDCVIFEHVLNGELTVEELFK